VIRSALLCLCCCSPLGFAGCGGSDKKSGTSAASSSTPVRTTGTQPAPRVGASQTAELRSAAACLLRFTRKLQGKQVLGKPAVFAVLKGGNKIALVLYGKAGGAAGDLAAVRKAQPKYSVFQSPDGQVLTFYPQKPDRVDSHIGNTCARAAVAAG
jgi:hypothetical protein